MFYLPARGCAALAADRTSGPLQKTCFSVFKLQGPQERCVFICLGRDASDEQACQVPGASRPSKSLQSVTRGSLVRSQPMENHAFGAKSLFYLTPERPVLAADRASWTPRTYVLQCSGSWAIKNVVFSYAWGVMAPMGKLVTCLGRLGRQNRIKGSRRVCFGGHGLLFFPTRTISWA